MDAPARGKAARSRVNPVSCSNSCSNPFLKREQSARRATPRRRIKSCYGRLLAALRLLK
jgi:hypothetical protein